MPALQGSQRGRVRFSLNSGEGGGVDWRKGLIDISARKRLEGARKIEAVKSKIQPIG